MRFTTIKPLIIASLLATVACTKEVEKIVVQDKEYSWAEVRQLSGSQKVIVQMTQDPASLFLQQLGYLGRLTPLPGALGPTRPGYYSAVSQVYQPLPYDLRNRIPMNAAFYLKPVPSSEAIVRAFPTTYMPPDNMPADLDLRKLDPSATAIYNLRASPYFAFGAISRNNYSLVGYTVAVAGPFMHLALSRLSLDSGVPTGPVTITSQKLTVPLPNNLPYTITAVDDYFLVNVLSEGLYKVTESGAVRKITGSPPTAIKSYYKHQSVLYAINDANGQKSIYSSADNGETWQQRSAVPGYFTISTFHAIGDSIVGITHGIENNTLYTLRWQGSTPRVRELKNDGLYRTDFTDLAQLGDTVYLSTTGGLFKRPVSTFFENR